MYNRREWIQRMLSGLGGGCLLRQLGGLGVQEDFAIKETFRLLNRSSSLKLGNLDWFVNSALSLASADPNEDWTIVTVKVCDNLAASLVFALGNTSGSGELSNSLSNEVHPATKRAGNATDYLAQNGIKNLCSVPRFALLRLNDFFGRRLFHGTYSGGTDRNLPLENLGFGSYLGQFPENVGLQCYLTCDRDRSVAVHNLVGLKIRPNLPDLNYLLAEKKLVNSPLGITCFMAGDAYDANGGDSTNVVYSGDSTSVAAVGKSVSSYVKILRQSSISGYQDVSLVEQNFLIKLDRYIFDKSGIRSSILESRASFVESLPDFVELQSLETSRHLNVDTSISNVQQIGVGSTGPARFEFLSQCAFVSRALRLRNSPLRNFSLFLNLNDLDGANFDVALNGITNQSYNSLSYVEGMRQLALGLNILAHGSAGKKVLVQVISDGGRDNQNGDSNHSFVMVMGPKIPGGLDDVLHGNLDQINQNTSDVFLNFGNTSVPWTTSNSESGLRHSDGTLNQTSVTQTGEVQLGLFRFLQQQQNKSLDLPGSGNFVQLKIKK